MTLLSVLIILPVVPLWAIGVGIIVILAAIIFFCSIPINGKKIAVLGPQGSGKTTFLSFLRNKQASGEATGLEHYKPFDYKLQNGQTVRIEGGIDIGGGDEYRSHYENLIKNNEAIIFIFDIHKYLTGYNKTKDKYVQLTDARFKLVYDHFKANHPGEIDPHKLVVIGSHKDKLKQGDNKIKGAFYNLIRKKEYTEMFKNFRICDLTNKNELKKIVDSIIA